MSLLTDNEFKVLSISADNRPHSKWEVVGMAVWMLKTNDKKFWKWFNRKFLEYNWIRLEERSADGNDALDKLKLTTKGDALLRGECIARRVREASFYQNFDRTAAGLDKFNPERIYG